MFLIMFYSATTTVMQPFDLMICSWHNLSHWVVTLIITLYLLTGIDDRCICEIPSVIRPSISFQRKSTNDEYFSNRCQRVWKESPLKCNIWTICFVTNRLEWMHQLATWHCRVTLALWHINRCRIVYVMIQLYIWLISVMWLVSHINSSAI